jgi:hypothetical protein
MKFVGVSETSNLFYKATLCVSSRSQLAYSPYYRTQMSHRKIRAFVHTGNAKWGIWIFYLGNELLGPREMIDAVFYFYIHILW